MRQWLTLASGRMRALLGLGLGLGLDLDLDGNFIVSGHLEVSMYLKQTQLPGYISTDRLRSRILTYPVPQLVSSSSPSYDSSCVFHSI